MIGLRQNPNEIVTNLTGDTITTEHESNLRFGLKHGLATRPKESDVIAPAESIDMGPIARQNLLPKGYMKQQSQRIKHSGWHAISWTVMTNAWPKIADI